MTKKHFQALADALKNGRPTITKFGAAYDECVRAWKGTVQDVANVCAQTNPRFDRARFLRACCMEDK